MWGRAPTHQHPWVAPEAPPKPLALPKRSLCIPAEPSQANTRFSILQRTAFYFKSGLCIFLLRQGAWGRQTKQVSKQRDGGQGAAHPKPLNPGNLRLLCSSPGVCSSF